MVIYIRVRHIVFVIVFALVIAWLLIVHGPGTSPPVVLNTTEPVMTVCPHATADAILREEEEFYFYWSNPMIDYTSTD